MALAAALAVVVLTMGGRGAGYAAGCVAALSNSDEFLSVRETPRMQPDSAGDHLRA